MRDNTQRMCFGSEGLSLLPWVTDSCEPLGSKTEISFHWGKLSEGKPRGPSGVSLQQIPLCQIFLQDGRRTPGGVKALGTLWHHRCVTRRRVARRTAPVGDSPEKQPTIWGQPEGGCLSPVQDGVSGDHTGSQLLRHEEELPVPGPGPHQHHQGHLPVLLPTGLPPPQLLEAQSASQSDFDPSQLWWAI